MRRDDREEVETCAICREEIEGDSDLGYRVSASTVICYDCARKHGGVYSSEKESWSVAPRLPPRSSLGDEEG